MDETLKPCPFCGSENVCLEADDNYYGSDWWAGCNDCLCRGPQHGTAEKATEAWNTAKGRNADAKTTQAQFTAFDPTDPTLGGWSR